MLVLERKEGKRVILETADGKVEIMLFNLQQGSGHSDCGNQPAVWFLSKVLVYEYASI